LKGSLRLWDRARFEYEEAAIYSPVGRGAIIHKVPVRKV
jgi:hypothetical protein